MPSTVATVMLCDGLTGFVWNINEAQTLRQKYRIVGSWHGTGGAIPGQESAHSHVGNSVAMPTIPHLLSPEEITLLLELQVIELRTGLVGGNSSPTVTCLADWSYPTHEVEQHRYELFKDLWTRGYFLTSGLKFGGEFLVYSGDPDHHHSRFITTILASAEQPLQSMELVGLSRLGTGVTKSRLLCVYDADTHQFRYITMDWYALT
ncbi:tRNA-splicing endonuclease subunit [Dispira simplex]|nr:tRNA-splicing endonuclease subunit [Dispira simplex]